MTDMQLPFVKMHGIGNDFVIVDAFEPGNRALFDIAARNAAMLCDRKFGVGADGVIVVLPAAGTDSDFRMVMFNPDGSEAEMCGNGIRCFARYVADRGYNACPDLRIATGRGILHTHIAHSDTRGVSVRVDMGAPILIPSDIPVSIPGASSLNAIDVPIEVDGSAYRVTCVSMGNPHCVVFVDSVEAVPLSVIGPRFEHHGAFPRRINTEFVQIVNRGEFRMRVWERGAGETLACGTGACAAAVACVLNGLTEKRVVGHLAGGDLELDWTEGAGVFMTGPAEYVFSGTVRDLR
jgi:diaminopimelate epimerase